MFVISTETYPSFDLSAQVMDQNGLRVTTNRRRIPNDWLIGLGDPYATPLSPANLFFVGLVVRAILGAVVVVTVLYLTWKLGKVADAYPQKLTTKQ